MSRFEAGQSSKPKGRQKGVTTVMKLREALREDLQEVIDAVVDAAKDGDMTAAKMVLDRLVPVLKPVDLPVAIEDHGTLSQRGERVISELSAGLMSPEQAERLIGALERQSKLVETDELIRRIEVLEGVDTQKD